MSYADGLLPNFPPGVNVQSTDLVYGWQTMQTPNSRAFTVGQLVGATANSFISTGTSALRTLPDRGADWINVKDYGALLNGTTNDYAAFQAAYSGAPANASINVPRGGFDVSGTLSRGSGNVLWKLDGSGFGASQIVPVTIIGDGDVTETFDGRKSFRKQLISSLNSYAVVEVTLDNENGSIGSGSVPASLVVNATAGPTSTGSTWAINTSLFAKSATAPGVGTASSVFRTGSGPTFQYFGQTLDQTGLPPNSGSSDVAVEFDLSTNGPEVATTFYAPGSGARSFIEIDNFTYLPPVWQANHAYAVGAAIQPTIANGFTYVCTIGGTSGSSQPTWPLSTGTVSDNTVTWKYGTTIATQVSRAIGIGSGPGQLVQYAAGIETTAAFYDAILEFSGATLVDGGVKNAAIRLAAGMPIDFSGDLTSAGQNLHTLAYDTVTSSLRSSGPFSVAGTLGVTGTTTLANGAGNGFLFTSAATNPTLAVSGSGTNGTLILHGQDTGGINLGSATSGNIMQLFAAASNTDTLQITQPTAIGQPLNVAMVQGAASGGILFRPFTQFGSSYTVSGSQAGPFWMSMGNNITGTTTQQQSRMFQFQAGADSIVPNSGAGSVTVLAVNDRLSAGWQGARVAIAGSVSDNATTTNGGNKVSLSGLSQSNFNNGGVSSGFGTTQFGLGSNFGAVIGIVMSQNATYMRGQTGIEVDVEAQAGSSYGACLGMLIAHVGVHAVQATISDRAFVIADGAGGVTAPWRDGLIRLGDYAAQWSADTTAYLIQATNGNQWGAHPATAAGGTDYLQATFSGSGFNGGGFAFRTAGPSGVVGATAIDGTGGIKLGVGYLSASSVGISIDTPLFVFSSVASVVSGGINFTTADLVDDGYGNLFSVTASSGVVTSLTLRARAEGQAVAPSGTINCNTLTRVGAAIGSGLQITETWVQATALSLGTTSATVINIGRSGQSIGFNGATAQTKPTVTGAKLPSDTVMASLLTALANYGLITDSTT